MCSVTSWLTSLIPYTAMNLWQEQNYDKAKKKTQKQIDNIKQEAADQVEANKLANGVQSTTPMEEEPLKQKLAAQKIPLNTTNTGLAVGNGLSSGLNLGGY